MNTTLSRLLLVLLLSSQLMACSTPEEKAEKYYNKGMELLDSDPEKAKLEFQNALQIKKNMTKALYGIALVAERKGDIKGTFGMLEAVIDQDPKNIDAIVKSGHILLAGNRVDLVEKRLALAKEINPNHVGTINLDAALQLKLNNPTQAIALAKKALSLDPKSQDALVVLASERYAAKAHDESLVYLDQAAAASPQNIAIKLFRITVLEAAGKLKEADLAFEEMIKGAVDQASARELYARYLVKHTRNREAEVQLREIIKLKPDELAPKIDLVKFIGGTQGLSIARAQLETFVKESPKNEDLAFALSDFYRQQGDATNELQTLKNIIAKSDNASTIYKAKGLLAYNLSITGKADEANALIDEVLKEDKNNEQALLLRASQLMAAKNYDAAIVDLRTVLREAPNNANAAMMLAKAHEEAGAPELAEEHYLKALQISKHSARFGMPYVDFLMRRKQGDRAEKIVEEILEHNPKDINVVRAAAQFKLQRGDKIGAQALADKAKELNKASPAGDEIEGAISLAQNDLQGTINAFQRAHAAAPNDSQPIIVLVNAYLKAGKKEEALKLIDSVLASNPQHQDVTLLKGQLYASTGEPDKAAGVFNGMIQASPKNPVGYQQLVLLQQRNNQLAEAETTAKQGLSAVPDDFGLKVILAGVYEANSHVDEAVKLYEQALKTRPDSQVVINNLASLLSERADKPSLERAYQLAIGLKNSEIPQFLDTYGWASYKVGKLDEAQATLKSVTEKLPNGAVYYYHLGKVYAAKNDIVLAKQAFQKAIKVAEGKPFNGKDDATNLLKSL